MKRGGLQQKTPLDESLQRGAPEGLDIIALDVALQRPTALDLNRKARS